MEPSFEGLARLAVRALGVTAALVGRGTGGGRVREWRADGSARTAPLDASPCRHVLGAGGPLLVADTGAHPLTRRDAALSGWGAFAAAPFPGGAVCVFSEAPRAWTADDAAALADLAASAAAAAAWRAEVEAHARTAAFCEGQRRVAEQIAGGATLGDTLDTLTASMEDRAHCGTRCAVLLAEGDALRHVAAPSLPASFTRALEAIGAAGPWGAGRPVAVADVAADPRWPALRDLARAHGLRACWSNPITGADGALLGAFVTWRDAPGPPSEADARLAEAAARLARIAVERDLAAAALRRQERRLEAVLGALPDLVWLKDLDSRFVAVNANVAAAAGRPAPELIGRTDHDFFTREDADHFVADDRAVAESGQKKAIVERLLGADGRERWLETTKAPFYDADGRIAGTIGIAREVTDRLHAEAALRDREARFRSLIENASDPITILGADGALRYWSPAYERLFGYPPADLLDGDVFRHVHPDDVAATLETFRQVLALPGEPRSLQLRYRHADGSWRTVVAVARNLLDDPAVAGIVVNARDITEQVQAEEALRASERRHRQLLDALPVCVYQAEAAPPYRTLYVSPAVRAFGFEPEAWIADPDAWRRHVHPEDVERVLAAFAGDQPLEAEYRVVLGDGSVRWVVDRAELLRDAEGRPLTWQGVMVDVTDQRTAQAALRESRALLATAEALARVGSWSFDPRTRALAASDEFYRIVGPDPDDRRPPLDEIIGRIVPEDLAAASRAFEGPPPPDGVTAVELRLRRPDGTVAHLLAHVRVERDAVGTSVRVYGSAQDVTDRVRAARALRDAHELLSRLIGDAPVAITAVDADLNVTTWNPAAERMFGWRADEVLGRKLPILPPERAFEVERLRAACREGRRIVGFATQRLRRDGSPLDVEIAAGPLYGEGGAFAGVIAFLTDVTGRKHLEEQLRQTQKIEAIGQLAGGIAHDFNNLIMVIDTHGEFLETTLAAGDERREELVAIRQAARRAAELTRQLLAFSRRQVLRPKLLDLNGTVAGLERMLRRLIGEDIAIATDLDPALGHVLADPGQVEQVLVNLCVNARDAMPRGGRLTLRTENVVVGDDGPGAPGPYVRLVVTDTGVGMAPDVQAHIFEPFFTTKEVGKGTGLGLATVYGIVRQSAGHIAVRSAPGRGTTFTIDLPRVAGGEPGSPAETPPPVAGAIGHEVVLLVEDEEPVRRLVHRSLTQRGYAVLEAADGGEALRLAAAHAGRIDLVLTDAVMPVMGGGELIRLLRASRPDLRILLMSGYTDDEIVRRGVLDPRASFLEKPFAVTELLRRVREVLDAPPAPLACG